MGDVEDILRQCEGFEWDDGNEDKNWEKHQISKSEAEQVFFNESLFVIESHGLSVKRYLAVGVTNSERKLTVIFTVRKKKFIRVISARNMSRKERSAYGKKS